MTSMEKNQLIFMKVSRLFPSSFSSCHFRTLPDVAESSITITKTPHDNDHSSSSFHKKHETKQYKNPCTLPKPCKRNPFLDHSSDAEGRKCPPVTPISALNPSKNNKGYKYSQQYCMRKSGAASANTSISSNSSSRWFTSSDDIKTRGNDDVETDAFFSLSSNSGDSFRLKASRRFRGREEMKSIDETGRCSFSSVASFDTVLSKTRLKTAMPAARKPISQKCSGEIGQEDYEHQMGCRESVFSTQLYYQKTGGRRSLRRRKTAKNRMKTRKDRRRSFDDHVSSVIEESYAVEKRSNDPYGDFRASMVEMIVEKQIFGADDLEKLLLCFLSLNAVSYHGIINDVYSEICQTLFCNS